MKKLIFLILAITFSPLFLIAQEIYLPPSVLSSAGGNVTDNEINISKWRLGEVYIVTLNTDDEDLAINNWQVSVYPNPARKNLHISFQIETTNDFSFEITNLKGKRMLLKKSTTVLPGREITIDVSSLSSGLYLLSIIPSDKEFLQVVKFQKQ